MRSLSLTLLSGTTSWSTKVCGLAVTVVLLQFSSSRSCQWTEVPLESDHTRSDTHFRLQFRIKHVRSWGCQFHAFHDLGLMSLISLCHLWLPHQFSKALHIAQLLLLCKKKCSRTVHYPQLVVVVVVHSDDVDAWSHCHVHQAHLIAHDIMFHDHSKFACNVCTFIKTLRLRSTPTCRCTCSIHFTFAILLLFFKLLFAFSFVIFSSIL